ncbi:MAG: hypothetical protein WCN92_06980 [Eubacteriales bacterium]
MKNTKFSFALAGSALITAFLITVNIMFSPDFLWVVFVILPVMWWPLTMLRGKRAASFKFAMISFVAVIIYYGLLNLLFLPGHLWIVYIAYAISWWPMTLFFVGRKQPFAYSVSGALISIAFFMIVNFITTPHIIWFVFPAFIILWWPLSIYFFVFKPLKDDITIAIPKDLSTTED